MEENSGDDQLFIPQVADDRKPKIGMEFESLDDAFSFYNQYAREAGFSARISNSKNNKMTNEVVWKKFVCFKEGHTDEIRSNKQVKGDQQKNERVRGEVRTGCKSKISIVRNKLVLIGLSVHSWKTIIIHSRLLQKCICYAHIVMFRHQRKH